jgi:hypothetical protein
MATIKKTMTTNVVEDVGKRNLYTLLVECKLVQPIRKSV